MDKSEMKKTTTIRIYDPHREMLVKYFGSVQRGVDVLTRFLEGSSKKEVERFYRESRKNERG